MDLKPILRNTTANKYRSTSTEEVVCCLEVPNELLYYWQVSKEKNIAKSINARVDEQSQAVTPLLAEDLSGTTSLENKLQIRGRSLMSSLSYSSRSRRKSMLKKSILVYIFDYHSGFIHSPKYI